MLHRRLGAAAVAALLGVGSEAAASGYAIREQSAVGQGTSFAGATARADDPSFLFFNRRRWAYLPGYQAAIVGSYIRPESRVDDGVATRNALLGGSRIFGSDGGDAGVNAFVPATYATAQLSPEWAVGLAVTAPFGLVTKYDNDFIGRYHALTSTLRTINLAPTVSYRPLPWLSFGASCRSSTPTRASPKRWISVRRARWAGSPLRRHAGAGSTGERRCGATTSPWAGRWSGVGAAGRHARRRLLPLRAVPQAGRATAYFQGAPGPLANSVNFRNTDVRAKLTTPETASFGVAQRVGERWTLLGDVSWTNWSRFRELRVDFDTGRAPSVSEQRWRDTWAVAVGAEYLVADGLRVRAGVAYDNSPARDVTRTPRIPDSDRYWLSVGASYQVLRNVELTAAYTHIFADDAKVRLRDRGPGTENFLRGQPRRQLLGERGHRRGAGAVMF
jgi:long-chain fatty acid transport protein